jgi:hypothetical protein
MRESEAESEEPLHLTLPFSKSLQGQTLDSIAGSPKGMGNHLCT